MSLKHRKPGGSGRKDKRRGFRNVKSERMRELAVAHRREGGVHDATVLAEQEGIRRAIDAQLCPFCERGPFKMLPVHTNKIHGIDKWELREMAGYSTQDPICSDEVRAAMSAAYDHQRHAEIRARATTTSKTRQKPRFTTAGLRKNASNLAAWEAANPEDAQAVRQASLAKTRTPEAVAKRVATVREQWAELSPEERARRSAHLTKAENRAALRAAIAAKPRRIPEHGDVNRYKHHGCRCDPCRAAKAEDRRRAKERT